MGWQDARPAENAIIQECSELLLGREERSYAFDSAENRDGAL